MSEEKQIWTSREREKETELKRRYCLPPCPSYDVDGMEQWLGDMAKDGWLLQKDGFFAELAGFTESAPCAARYRLEAAPKSTSMWAENGGEPDPEALALSEQYAWEYVGKRGCFYIYRTLEPGARELNTDPTVQALAVDAAQKRQVSSLVSTFLGLILYIGLYLARGGALLSAVETGTGWSVFSTALLLWLLGEAVAEVVAMERLKRRLRKEVPAPPARARHPGRYFASRAALAVCGIVWICVLLHQWSISVMDEDKTPLSQDTPAPPFATLTDFAGEGAHDYQRTMLGSRFNYIKTWSDPLAPENITWAEHASVQRADGTLLDGGLYVYYHKAANPWIARQLAQEYIRRARWDKNYEALDLPALDVDFAAAYRDELHWANIVVQKGSVVCRVMLYETGDGPHMTLDEWAGIFVQSLSDTEKG